MLCFSLNIVSLLSLLAPKNAVDTVQSANLEVEVRIKVSSLYLEDVTLRGKLPTICGNSVQTKQSNHSLLAKDSISEFKSI